MNTPSFYRFVLLAVVCVIGLPNITSANVTTETDTLGTLSQTYFTMNESITSQGDVILVGQHYRSKRLELIGYNQENRLVHTRTVKKNATQHKVEEYWSATDDSGKAIVWYKRKNTNAIEYYLWNGRNWTTRESQSFSLPCSKKGGIYASWPPREATIGNNYYRLFVTKDCTSSDRNRVDVLNFNFETEEWEMAANNVNDERPATLTIQSTDDMAFVGKQYVLGTERKDRTSPDSFLHVWLRDGTRIDKSFTHAAYQGKKLKKQYFTTGAQAENGDYIVATIGGFYDSARDEYIEVADLLLSTKNKKINPVYTVDNSFVLLLGERLYVWDHNNLQKINFKRRDGKNIAVQSVTQLADGQLVIIGLRKRNTYIASYTVVDGTGTVKLLGNENHDSIFAAVAMQLSDKPFAMFSYLDISDSEYSYRSKTWNGKNLSSVLPFSTSTLTYAIDPDPSNKQFGDVIALSVQESYTNAPAINFMDTATNEIIDTTGGNMYSIALRKLTKGTWREVYYTVDYSTDEKTYYTRTLTLKE